MTARLDDTIESEANYTRHAASSRHQECFAVRAGLDGLLDVARATYLDQLSHMEALLSQYHEAMDVPIKLSFR